MSSPKPGTQVALRLPSSVDPPTAMEVRSCQSPRSSASARPIDAASGLWSPFSHVMGAARIAALPFKPSRSRLPRPLRCAGARAIALAPVVWRLVEFNGVLGKWPRTACNPPIEMAEDPASTALPATRLCLPQLQYPYTGFMVDRSSSALQGP